PCHALTPSTSPRSLRDALPICGGFGAQHRIELDEVGYILVGHCLAHDAVGKFALARHLSSRETTVVPEGHGCPEQLLLGAVEVQDRKSTRLNSSHVSISYADFW